jgi:hypothetical protein
MPVTGGLNSQLGIAEEVTPGTAVTVTRFLEFDKETLKNGIERVEHSGLRPTRRVLGSNNWKAGKHSPGGTLEMVLQSTNTAVIFKHALGAVATTTPVSATLARQHKCTVGAIDGKSLSIQVGLTSDDGTTRTKTYAGCKISEWEISNKVGENVNLALTIDAIAESVVTALAVASYPTTTDDFFYIGGAIQIAGAATDVSEWSLKGSNGLNTDDRYYIRATTPHLKKEQLEGKAQREYAGELTIPFLDWTAYNRFVNGTTASLMFTYATASFIEGSTPWSFTISIPAARFDGDTPAVDGTGSIPQKLPFKVVDAGDTDGPIVVTIVNAETTA